MKIIILAILFLSPPALFAQSLPPAPNSPMRQLNQRGSQGATTTFPDNYQVTLIITDQDVQPLEVSVVIASTRFNTLVGERGLSFEGFVTIEESGSAVIEYALAWSASIPGANGNVEFRQSSTTGSVRLKLGEEVQIIRAASRLARLSIKKLEPSKPK